MTEDDEATPLPELPAEKGGKREFVEKAVEAAGGSVPFVGGALAVILAHAFSHAYEQRLRDWMEQLADVVQELLDRVDELDVESLADDSAFLDAVATATRIAEKTSSAHKRAALQNALLNVGTGSGPGEDKTSMFLRYIDDLTPSHMRLLRFLSDPRGAFGEAGLEWPNMGFGSLRSIFERLHPEIAKDEAFLNAILGNLHRAGLTLDTGMGVVMSDGAFDDGRVTSLGNQFTAFVTGPFGLTMQA